MLFFVLAPLCIAFPGESNEFKSFTGMATKKVETVRIEIAEEVSYTGNVGEYSHAMAQSALQIYELKREKIDLRNAFRPISFKNRYIILVKDGVVKFEKTGKLYASFKSKLFDENIVSVYDQEKAKSLRKGTGAPVLQEYSTKDDRLIERCIGKTNCLHFFGIQSKLCKNWFDNCKADVQKDKIILTDESIANKSKEVFVISNKDKQIISEHRFYDKGNLLLLHKTTESMVFKNKSLPKSWEIDHYEGPVLVSTSKFKIVSIVVNNDELDTDIERNPTGEVYKYKR